MNIINIFPENTSKRDIFKMTKDNDIMKMSEHVGETINPVAYVIYEDVDKKDESKFNTILSVMADDGTVYATNSKTFTDMFVDIHTMMEELVPIIIRDGVSKNGRTFLTTTIL